MRTVTRTIVTAAALSGLVLMAGCTYVKLKPKAENVTVLDQGRAEKCEKIGQTKVSVATQVGFIARGQSAIAQDLKVLARNSGAGMGGDTVAALSEIQDGEQTFGVYDCLDD
ncbi:MAG: DUF4156 domain-containing protein [Halofilum sp. (in: g-proteobacteria)]|nr:DUF4156 domain-containing protein [Halofilum sp. (in: g-proteobacteria)]